MTCASYVLLKRFSSWSDIKFVSKPRSRVFRPTAEGDRLDKTLIVAVSKPPAERNRAAEDQIRKRIEAITSERDRLQEVFNQRFPDYVTLSKPQPLPLKQTQALLADDEALLVFDFSYKSYAWIITPTAADWIELAISSEDLDVQVRTLREVSDFSYRQAI